MCPSSVHQGVRFAAYACNVRLYRNTDSWVGQTTKGSTARPDFDLPSVPSIRRHCSSSRDRISSILSRKRCDVKIRSLLLSHNNATSGAGLVSPLRRAIRKLLDAACSFQVSTSLTPVTADQNVRICIDFGRLLALFSLSYGFVVFPFVP